MPSEISMPQLPRDKHLFDPGPKRILALDGGGIRGMFTLQILYKIEAMVQERTGSKNARLSDYFDLIGGTSTGSIIASGLSLGWSVEKLENLYHALGNIIFEKLWYRKGIFRSKFSEKPLRKELDNAFRDHLLGDERILTGLAIVSKRLDTGSPWVMFNNPKGPYFNKDKGKDGQPIIPNKNYLLRNIIRASTAAPFFFVPEPIEISKTKTGLFVDGGVSAHNNPALLMLQLATIDSFQFGWPAGEDKLLVVSVGTGFKSMKYEVKKVLGLPIPTLPGALALHSLQSLMDDVSHLNEQVLQMLSNSPTSRPFDPEIGEANASSISPLISYLRYDAELDPEWLKKELDLSLSEKESKRLLAMDDSRMLDLLRDVGKRTADNFFDADHFPSQFDIPPIMTETSS